MLIFLNMIGYISSVITLVMLLTSVVAYVLGLFPVLKRFGFNRWKMKIAVVTDDNNLKNTVNTTLTKCKLIRKRNLEHVSNGVLKTTDNYSLVVVCEDMLSKLDKIVDNLSSKTALIVYAPKVRLNDEQLEYLNRQPVSALVNFKGRLIGDVINMLVSTEYVEK